MSRNTKEQFRGLPIEKGMTVRYGQVGDMTLDAVTGATQTSSAVLRIINAALNDLFGEGN